MDHLFIAIRFVCGVATAVIAYFVSMHVLRMLRIRSLRRMGFSDKAIRGILGMMILMVLK